MTRKSSRDPLTRGARRAARIANTLSAVGLACLLGGCATAGGTPGDPLEPLNRAVFSFNETLDEAVLQPVARGYRAVVPGLVRTGVMNFFSNLEDLWIGANNLLQGKVADGIQDLARFTFNSTFGLLGVLDVSTDFKLPKHNEDFGQTLGRWGIGSGAYLVLPFFGSSSLRDGIGLVADLSVDPVVNMGHVPTRNASIALRTASMRAGLLDESRLLEEAALDKYRFVRNAYLQRRRSLVYDGNPPEERQRGASAQPAALARARAGDREDAERPGDAPAGARDAPAGAGDAPAGAGDASAGAGDARGAVAEADRP